MPTANPQWDRFHDATLLAITTDWASGETRLRVRVWEEAAREVEIRIANTTLLHCPREQPWGPSVSINHVRINAIEAGRVRLEIEIQSGDVVEIVGDTVSTSSC